MAIMYINHYINVPTGGTCPHFDSNLMYQTITSSSNTIYVYPHYTAGTTGTQTGIASTAPTIFQITTPFWANNNPSFMPGTPWAHSDEELLHPWPQETQADRDARLLEMLHRDRDRSLRAQERARIRQERDLARHSEDAIVRARKLLLRHLTDEQHKEFTERKYFTIIGKSGAQYRIYDRGHLAANIGVIANDHETHRLCAHCNVDAVPLYDSILAQKLMLEADEAAFLKVANRHAA